MAPVIAELRSRPDQFGAYTCATAQHRDMLDQVLGVFGISPEYDLDLMRANQSLTGIVSGVLGGLETVIAELKPDVILAQGDTTTTFAACLAGAMHRIKVGHVEAGLRTYDRSSPFPEEMNRRMASVVADWHFAPTDVARDNLLREQIPEDDILVSGNTVIDALLIAAAQSIAEDAPPFDQLDADKRLIVVTAHRRESFGPAFEGMCNAIRQIVARNDDVEVVYPVHPNPNVREPVHRLLAGDARIHLIEPLPYLEFVHVLKRSYLILTDSGGVQEEAPSLGVPVLVMRDTTERPEGVDAGTSKLIGTEPIRILSEVQRLLDTVDAREAMTNSVNPYGDGRSAQRIADFLRSRWVSG